MTSQLVLIALLDGIAYAALVFIVSVGLTLIFGVLRVLNIAHGANKLGRRRDRER